MTVHVELGERSYPIMIGQGLLDRVDDYLTSDRWPKAALIADSNVDSIYGERVFASLCRTGMPVIREVVEPGEASKDLGVALGVVRSLVASRFNRDDLVVALGGGVVGDLAGFVASIYKRGLDLLSVPTSLMSQVDSSVGGKTAVNLPEAKNLLGTFHQPVAVVSDVETLATLPPREFTSGLAEVAKYSFLRPGEWNEGLRCLSRGPSSCDVQRLATVISQCVEIKARIVAADEFDIGVRTQLNYGHTLGHALEAATEYSGVYSHGEAISVGMMFAAIVAEEDRLSPPGLAARHEELLASLGLPTKPFDPVPQFSLLHAIMEYDKKSSSDITMLLLQHEGDPVLRHALDWEVLARSYDRLCFGT